MTSSASVLYDIISLRIYRQCVASDHIKISDLPSTLYNYNEQGCELETPAKQAVKVL